MYLRISGILLYLFWEFICVEGAPEHQWRPVSMLSRETFLSQSVPASTQWRRYPLTPENSRKSKTTCAYIHEVTFSVYSRQLSEGWRLFYHWNQHWTRKTVRAFWLQPLFRATVLSRTITQVQQPLIYYASSVAVPPRTRASPFVMQSYSKSVDTLLFCVTRKLRSKQSRRFAHFLFV